LLGHDRITVPLSATLWSDFVSGKLLKVFGVVPSPDAAGLGVCY
jgi:hypothetical protein